MNIKEAAIKNSPFEHHSFGHETHVTSFEAGAQFVLDKASEGFDEYFRSLPEDTHDIFALREAWQAARLSSMKEIEELRNRLSKFMANPDYTQELESKVSSLRECVGFYANTEKYRRPDKDRNGMGGMSSQTDFEIEDGEWKIDDTGEKDHYCYGKLARETLKKLDD